MISLKWKGIFKLAPVLVMLLVSVIFSCSCNTEEPMRFYVGSYSGSDQPGIYTCELDQRSGKLEILDSLAGIENPSFLVLGTQKDFLYAVSETDHYNKSGSGGVSAYRIDPASGKPSFLNSVSSGGAHPCHLTIHPTGKYLFVANYSDGNLSSIPLEVDGSLRSNIHAVQHLGSGPNPNRQEAAHAHSANITADGRFLYGVDLGIDRIMGYRVDPGNGHLIPSQEATLQVDPGSGPRHMTFRKDQRVAYVINELNSSVYSCIRDPENGQLHIQQRISTLPVDFQGENYCADIHIHPNDNYLYASNRGHNSIAVFKIEADGTLNLIQNISSGGEWPRNFAIVPSGKFMLVANQNSDRVVLLQVDLKTGMLSESGIRLKIPKPVCITCY